MPRTKPPQERRTDLLDAAQALVVEKGVAATTLDDVTRRAGVAKGTFYLYFESKDHLVLALRERFVDELIARQSRALERLPPGDWSARLDRWIEDGIHAYVEHAELHDVLFEHDAGATPVHSGITPENRHLDALEALLRQRRDPPPDAPDPQTASVLIYAALHGATHYLLHEEATGRVEAIVEAAKQLARRYLLVGDEQ
jgi:AcrR family transcriptional regulator